MWIVRKISNSMSFCSKVQSFWGLFTLCVRKISNSLLFCSQSFWGLFTLCELSEKFQTRCRFACFLSKPSSITNNVTNASPFGFSPIILSLQNKLPYWHSWISFWLFLTFCDLLRCKIMCLCSIRMHKEQFVVKMYSRLLFWKSFPEAELLTLFELFQSIW